MPKLSLFGYIWYYFFGKIKRNVARELEVRREGMEDNIFDEVIFVERESVCFEGF